MSSVRITMVNMPWQTVSWPSLAMSALDSVLVELGHAVTQLYENLRFAEFCLDPEAGLMPGDYFTVSDEGFEHGVGEWVFTSALYRPGWRESRVRRFLAERDYRGIDRAVTLHHRAPLFVHEAADRVLDTRPDLVGLTTTFEQNVASLALARELKRRRAGLPIMLGGANCDGDMGAALHRNFSDIDFVVRGEGERPLRELLGALTTSGAFVDVPSLCWRDPAGRSVANPYTPTMTPGPALPTANVRPYFEQIDQSPARPWIPEVFLRVETSRGCWWGERRQCTFCGLNGDTIAYRAKPADRAWKEITDAVTEFGVLDITLTDNILDPAYIETLLPRLAASGWDLRIFYEVKSNLRPAELAVLADAGVTVVQPGIESLASGPLSLMDKGTTGAAQVRALRLFREHGIFPGWNYIYGFPGEDWARDYQPVVDQMPALVHLPPPGKVGRLTLDRFSPLFNRPELGIDDVRRPVAWYDLVYDLPAAELADLAYLFDYRARGIDDAAGAVLAGAVDAWREAYPRSSLSVRAVGSAVHVSDRRPGWPGRDHVLRGSAAAAYLTLARHLSVPALVAALRGAGHDIDPVAVEPMLRRWQADGLVYSDNGTYVALAIAAGSRHPSTWREPHDLIPA
jgi:ribosomal peptide maturation radical SAM protein 1